MMMRSFFCCTDAVWRKPVGTKFVIVVPIAAGNGTTLIWYRT